MMKQRLLKTIALGLMAMVGVNAWADNTVRYSTDGGTEWTEAEKLSSLSTVLSSATGNVQVEVMDDQVLTDRITWNKAHTLTITPTKDITIKGPAGKGWFLANVNSAVLNIGSDTYTITMDGESKSHTAGDITFKEKNSTLNLNNITFKDFDLNSACHLISCPNNEGDANKLIINNITIENCTNPSGAYIYSARVINDVINLKGYLNIDADSKGTAIKTTTETKYDSGKSTYTTTGRIKVDDSSAALTATKTITVTFSESSATYVPQIGAAIIINSSKNWTDETASVFALANDVDYGVFKNNKDLKLTQAYNLSVTSASAATLVLPFEATIPSGATCYKLTYASGDNITAAAESTTLAANSAVLVKADEGKYKFVSTATSGSLATGSSQTAAYGNMVGNYDANYVVPANKYILTNHSGTVAFRKTNGTTNKIQANRAYLDVTYAAGAPEFLGINFDGNVTSIDAVEKKSVTEDGEIYNLQGVRMTSSSLPKGIYVKNGRKFVIK